MVVIFGFGSGKQKDLGEVAPGVCPNCHNQVFLHHVRSKKAVRLYFVPVVPYGTDDYLVCPICSRGLQLSKAQLARVKSMRAATAALRAGRLAEPQYQAKAEQFWRQLGLGPAAQRPAAARPAAPPPATAAQPAPAPPAAQPAPAPPAAQPAPVPPAAQPAPAPPAAPAGPPPAAGAGQPWVAQLAQLTQLHDQGVLSDADYEAAKQRLLGPG